MSKEKFKTAIEEYTGEKVKKIATFNDPLNSSYVAIRATMEDGSNCDFLFNWNEEISQHNLEDANFETWPPKSEKSNMYKVENMWVSS